MFATFSLGDSDNGDHFKHTFASAQVSQALHEKRLVLYLPSGHLPLCYNNYAPHPADSCGKSRVAEC